MTFTKDNIVGCLVLGAVGDAMGRPYEGKSGPVSYQEHSPWQITDDTQFIMATCESIIEFQEISPDKIAQSFLMWHRSKGFVGIGSSTLKALRDLSVGGHWALSGARGERAAGNGAAMRIAPLAFFLDPDNDSNRKLIQDICRITHFNDEAYAGALAIIYSIRSKNPENLLNELPLSLPDSNVRDRIVDYSKIKLGKTLQEVSTEFGTSGYVAESVPFAIYAAIKSINSSFKETMINIIETGGDTDTTASMAGNLIGSWFGLNNINNCIYNKVPCLTEIVQLGESLYDWGSNKKMQPDTK
ncbi:MAG: hypothetical protein GY928_30225 [Colwellia sp.]|nr:hypothetical protein [Colwellia sp.]